jgi:conjugal transfer pilus assembly protein TraB
MASPKQIKRRQLITFLVSSSLVFLTVQLFAMWVKKSKDPLQVVSASKTYTWPSSKDVDLREHWFRQIENDNKDLRITLKQTTDELSNQRQQLEELNKKMLFIKTKAEHAAFTKEQNLAEEAPGSNEQTTLSNVVHTSVFPEAPMHSGKQQATLSATSGLPNNKIETVSVLQGITGKKLNLGKPKNLFSVESYIPAGSFVQAHVIGGMMASAGLDSQGEPRPVLLRITDLTQLPNRIQRSIKDCHVVAGGHGDVSSRRAYIRTETLSCTLIDGQVFEEKVEGYLAGGDSMSGIQGQVIRNEKDMISNAFLAGLIRGGGNAIAGSLGSTATSPLGTVRSLGKKDIMPSMLAEGAGDAANTLEDYFIQLAKQHHPVIEVTPGQEVSIVFLKGLSFDGVVK